MATQIAEPEITVSRSMLLTALYIAQEQFGYLSPEAISRVAARFELTPGQVYNTATFYSMFRFQPSGRHVLQVCEGLSCHLAGGAETLLEYLQKKLHIRVGGVSKDGRFELQAVQCLAACGSSPAMRVNDTLYENLTPESVDEILRELGG